MGRDGLEGAKAVRAAGGRILVEAESTCTVYGMPRAVAEAGLADEVAAARRARRRDRPGGRAMSLTERSPAVATTHRRFEATVKADDFVALCELVRRLCGVDLPSTSAARWSAACAPSPTRRGTPDLAAYGAAPEGGRATSSTRSWTA